MQTYYLGDHQVGAYAADLAARLVELGDNTPQIWVSLGVSGDKLTEELLKKVAGTSAEPTQLHRAAFDRSNKSVSGRDGEPLPSGLGDTPVLVIDAAVHSGTSMRYLVDALSGQGCRNILSYSLVVKITSEFVPSLFGLMIGEHDRAFFQLERIPNNRLLQKPPFGSIRLLREGDVERDPDCIKCGVPSLDHMTFGDLWYYTKTQGSHDYLYEIGGRIAGFIHFKKKSGTRLFIDLIANDVEYQGVGIGGILMRWAETFARNARMLDIDLWAIDGRQSFYERHGYAHVGETMNCGGEGETYHLMRRRLLYNLKPEDMPEAA